jgi:hypothetical protein
MKKPSGNRRQTIQPAQAFRAMLEEGDDGFQMAHHMNTLEYVGIQEENWTHMRWVNNSCHGNVFTGEKA